MGILSSLCLDFELVGSWFFCFFCLMLFWLMLPRVLVLDFKEFRTDKCCDMVVMDDARGPRALPLVCISP